MLSFEGAVKRSDLYHHIRLAMQTGFIGLCSLIESARQPSIADALNANEPGSSRLVDKLTFRYASSGGG
jgi:hypothetical protein